MINYNNSIEIFFKLVKKNQIIKARELFNTWHSTKKTYVINHIKLGLKENKVDENIAIKTLKLFKIN